MGFVHPLLAILIFADAALGMIQAAAEFPKPKGFSGAIVFATGT